MVRIRVRLKIRVIFKIKVRVRVRVVLFLYQYSGGRQTNIFSTSNEIYFTWIYISDTETDIEFIKSYM